MFTSLSCHTITFVFGLLPSVFLLRKKKGTKEIRPITTCPEGQATASNFANASVESAVQADQPQFAVHGELPLPKLNSEAGCTRDLKYRKAKKQDLNLLPLFVY